MASDLDINHIQDITDLGLEELLNPHVVSASRLVEQAREAPVPVTVITASMLRAIGARTLEDALRIYVPGITAVQDHNEANVAMRGVYASAQQKILILVDGHRLNSRAYSQAAPDWSISVDPNHIQQIEVLRGPGSAIYGNVAFTAVVNIVTIDGGHLDGVAVRSGFGNYGQRYVSATYGADIGKDGDMLLWGSAHRALGETFEISRQDDFSADPHKGKAIVGGDRDPGSYDVGLSLRQGVLRAYLGSRYGKTTEPFTAGGPTGAVYDADAMRDDRGRGPGLGSESQHLDLAVVPSISERTDIEVGGTYDRNQITGQTTTGYLTHISAGWNEHAIGGRVILRTRYDLAGEGSLLFGLASETFRLANSWLLVGVNDGEWELFGDTKAAPLLVPGTESIHSGFVQLKHTFAEQFTINLGGRIDYKQRRLPDDVFDLPDQADLPGVSPRLAAIWHPSDLFSTKLSYAESFVDAPYWYRYSTLASYQGAISLVPEHLRSVQFAPTVQLFDNTLQNTVNVSYNQLSDFIWRDNEADLEAGEPSYRNAGELETVTLEEEVAYVHKVVQARGNATYQHVVKADKVQVDPGAPQVHNVPPLVANVIVGVNVLQPLDQLGWVDVALRYTGAQQAPILAASIAQPNLAENRLNTLPASVVIDAGLRLERPLEWLSLDARVYNLFDQRTQQGGSTLFPYPQPGRWFLVNAEVYFR